MEPRPRALTVIAAFLFAATLIADFVGASLLPGRLLDWFSQFNKPGMDAFRAMGRFSGVLLLALSAGTASAAMGLLIGKRWAWWFAVGLLAIDAAGGLV